MLQAGTASLAGQVSASTIAPKYRRHRQHTFDHQ